MSSFKGKGVAAPRQTFSIFNFPPSLLATLSLSSDHVHATVPPLPADDISREFALSARIAQPTCHTCGGVQFDGPEDQRQHFKTSWHHRNLARKMEWHRRDGVPSAGEYPWMPLASDEIEERESDSDSDPLVAAPKRRGGGDPKLSAGLLWFSANDAEDAMVYGVHRRILVPKGVHRVHVDAGDVLAELRALQQPVAGHRTQAELKEQKRIMQSGGQSASGSTLQGPPPDNAKLWAIVALDGGYFAGAIVDTLTGDFLIHKTLARYTTRRKQGGTQSRQDSAMGFAANSAGAQIRRHNEQRLQADIHAIMAEWRVWLSACTRILVRVPRVSRKDFFAPASAPLHPLRWSDPRIRDVPVPMARPSLAELRRVYTDVTTVSIATVEKREEGEEEVAEDPAEEPFDIVDSGSASDSTLEPEPRPDLLALLHHVATMIQNPALSDNDIIAHVSERLEQLLDALSDPALGLRYLTTTDAVQSFRTPTLLHVASQCGRADLVPFLLDNGEDPTVTSGHPPLFTSGVTAFEIARDRRTRDAFRVYRSEHQDDVDWVQARVPPPLTRAQAADAEDRARAKRRKDKERKKAKEREQRSALEKEKRVAMEQLEAEDNDAMDRAQAQNAKGTGVAGLSDSQLRARMLSSAYASAQSWGAPSALRLVSPNTQRAIDRELRVQAIARRQQPAGGGSTNSAARCTHCNKLLHGLVPFEMFDWVCCSRQCLHGHQALYGAPLSP